MKGKISKYIIILLIVLNLVSLFFLLKPHRPNPPKLTDVIEFEEPVKSKINEMEKIHFYQMKSYMKKIQAIRSKIYSKHLENADKIDYASHYNDLEEYTKKIEKLRFKYFSEIRNLCNYKQKDELDLFIQHMIEHESMRRPKGE